MSFPQSSRSLAQFQVHHTRTHLELTVSSAPHNEVPLEDVVLRTETVLKLFRQHWLPSGATALPPRSAADWQLALLLQLQIKAAGTLPNAELQKPASHQALPAS